MPSDDEHRSARPPAPDRRLSFTSAPLFPTGPGSSPLAALGRVRQELRVPAAQTDWHEKVLEWPRAPVHRAGAGTIMRHRASAALNEGEPKRFLLTSSRPPTLAPSSALAPPSSRPPTLAPSDPSSHPLPPLCLVGQATYTAHMSRVLKLIQLWHLALVPKSRHRDDLLNISEMYKLLQAKGLSLPCTLPSLALRASQHTCRLCGTERVPEQGTASRRSTKRRATSSLPMRSVPIYHCTAAFPVRSRAEIAGRVHGAG